jgi:hypothetical protein
MNELILFLALLQIKHWYVDFVNQTSEEVASKGIYGDRAGINHSAKHAIGTFVAVLLVTGFPYIAWAGFLAGVDFFFHYHIDWAKININNKYNYTVQDKQFWLWLGADQMAHQLTYLLLVWMMFA